MFRLAWRGVRFNVGRYVATLVAILTGVGFFAASGFLSDRVIDALEGAVDQQFGAIEVAVIPDPAQSAVAASRLRIDVDLAREIEALPEVGAVAGELSGSVAFLGADGDVVAEGAVGRIWVTDDRLNPLDIDEGTAPVAADEIAIDRRLAQEEDIGVGDRVVLLSLAGETEMTITGTTRFGDNDAIDGSGTVSLPEANAFDLLNQGQREYSALFVRSSGEGPRPVAEAVGTVVPDGFMVLNGDDFRDDKRSEVGGLGRVLKRALQFFAVLALLVGGFVIYNTFNVIVAQRTRELAVLAAIGATPRQIKRSLRWEAIVIGVLGSALASSPGSDGLRPDGRPRPVGCLIARERDRDPTEHRRGRLRLRDRDHVRLGNAARRPCRSRRTAGGAASGRRGHGVGRSCPGRGRRRRSGARRVGMFVASDARVIGVCALVLFGGVIAAGPVIAVAGSAVLRPLLRPFGLEGRLAADNTARNPHRTAATSNALLIGVFLVTFVSIAGTSAKDYAVAQINELSTADYTIESEGGTIDDALVASIAAVEGVEQVTPFRREAVGLTVDGVDQGASTLSSGDIDALVSVAGIDLKAGSLDDLRPGTVVLLDSQSGGGASGAPPSSPTVRARRSNSRWWVSSASTSTR